MKRETWRRLGAAAGVLVLAVVVGGAAMVYSGAYNVAATERHDGWTERALRTVMERSVRARADVEGGATAVDSATRVHGFVHFDAMCVECHGAPGVERGEYGHGLNPEPPDLVDVAPDWSDAELFWITKHGIRMTGMPAFGPTHTDEELWAIVAALRRVEAMTPEEYAATIAAADGEHSHEAESGDHTHPPGTPEHEH